MPVEYSYVACFLSLFKYIILFFSGMPLFLMRHILMVLGPFPCTQHVSFFSCCFQISFLTFYSLIIVKKLCYVALWGFKHIWDSLEFLNLDVCFSSKE